MAPAEESKLDLVHLRRETRTALELAIVALAPPALMNRLASATGMLEALSELPMDGPAKALVPGATDRARKAIEEWEDWEASHVPSA